MTGELLDGPTSDPALPPGLEAFDWSQMDLSRHDRLFGHAQLLVELVKGCVSELDSVLREFGAAASDAGLTLRYDRDPDALAWTLQLSGQSFRVSGVVEIALASVNCVSISAHPRGSEHVLRYEVTLGRIEDFPGQLSEDFRIAVVSSVLDARPLISVRLISA